MGAGRVLGFLLVVVFDCFDGWGELVIVPAGMTAFLKSQDPRFESRPRCHRLLKSAYGESPERSCHWPCESPLEL